jgi:acetyl-CoA carboxylase biotin carboxyl carrier protein
VKVRSEMSAVVVRVPVAVGDGVSEGQVVVVIESMKIEIAVPAPVAGKVAAMHVREGDQVREGDVLVTLADPDPA